MDRLELIQILALVALVGLAAGAGRRPRRSPRRAANPAATGRPGALGAWGGPPAHWPLGRLAGAAPLMTEAAWADRLAVEGARQQRYGRPVTVVAMHLGGSTGALARRTVQRRAQVAQLAGRMHAGVRATDVVRLGSDGIVRILLTETDEEGGRTCAARLARIVPAGGVAEGVGVPRACVTAAWAETRSGRDVWAANRLATARLRGASAGWLRSGAVHRQPERTLVLVPSGQATADEVSPTTPEQGLRESRS